MTTLTMEDAPVEPTSAHAEITHLAQRQRLAAMVPVLAALTADATHHLPYICRWEQSVSYSDPQDDNGIEGQLTTSSSSEDPKAAAVANVAQWADYLGTEVRQRAYRHSERYVKVWCEAVIDGVRVEIFSDFRTAADTDTTETV